MKSMELKIGQVLTDVYGNTYTVESFDRLISIQDEPQEIEILKHLRNDYGADFVDEQINKGIEVEYEHTSDTLLSRNIAIDHITQESIYYYIELEKMERRLEA